MKLIRLSISFLLLVIYHQAVSQQPNILWLTCEDISPTLSMYGDSTAKTPNLDRLAAESFIFNNAFAPVGVCAPSRSSIITGMYPTSIGTHNMRTGKDVMGWGKREYDGDSNAMDINGDTIPFYSAVPPPEVKCFTEYLRAAGYFCTNNPKTDYQFAAPVTAWDENGRLAHWKNRGNDQPFFSVFNANVSHESFLWKNKDLPLTVSPDSVSLPDYFPDTEIVRNDVARNYSNIELMDAQIGKRLKELENAGLLDNTIIFFFSDHGGPLPRGKRLHYESGLRVPMMVRIPGQLKQQYVEELVSFVDLAPTILSLAGIAIPEHFQGESFIENEKVKTNRQYIIGSGDRFDEHSDRVRTVIDEHFIYVRNYHPELPAYKDVGYRKQIPMMKELLDLHEAGKLDDAQDYWFRQTKTEEEFYIRSSDPYNLNNQIENSQYKEVINEMREELDRWIDKNGDKGAISEKELFLSMWPDGKQPQACLPKVKVKKGFVEISSKEEGVSLAYLIADQPIEPTLDSGWQLYTKPVQLKAGQYLYAIATRLGYKDSEVVMMD